jgi:hypothetical protein
MVAGMSAIAVTERQFQSQVIQLARLFGWRTQYHWREIHSPAGWPDLTLVQGEVAWFSELKRDTGIVTPAQQEWLDALAAVREVHTGIWRPSQFEQIAELLQRRGRG